MDIKNIISKNLIFLRKSKNMTQKDLAEKLNYSDKAISRWELGENLPNIDTLNNICEFYNIDFNWLITEHENDKVEHRKKQDDKNYIKITIAILSIVCCYTLATILFVYKQMMSKVIDWQVFIWALPISFIILSICSQLWWRKLTPTFISLAMWTLILSIFLSLIAETNAWPLFLLGCPFQVIIILLAILHNSKNKVEQKN